MTVWLKGRQLEQPSEWEQNTNWTNRKIMIDLMACIAQHLNGLSQYAIFNKCIFSYKLGWLVNLAPVERVLQWLEIWCISVGHCPTAEESFGQERGNLLLSIATGTSILLTVWLQSLPFKTATSHKHTHTCQMPKYHQMVTPLVTI